MAIDRSDLRDRLWGLLFFLPVLIPVCIGYPYTLIGTSIAGLWILVEALSLLSGRLASFQRYLAFILSCGVFCIPLIATEQIGLLLPSLQWLAFFILSGTIMLLLKGREWVFVLLLMATLFSLSYLSIQPDGGFILVMLACLISASDIGAYFTGRIFGGPKLAPSVSPSKTWSGSIGGLLFSLLVAEGILFVFYQQHLGLKTLPAIMLIGVLSQAGDLFESALKRRLNVKDSSSFVPGHGGALDRFDGYLMTVPVVVGFYHLGYRLPLLNTGLGVQ